MRIFLIPSMLIIVLGGLLGVTKASEAQKNQLSDVNLSLHLDDVSVMEVLQTIEKETEFTFAFNYDQLNLDRVVSVEAQSRSVEEILYQLFHNTRITWGLSDNVVLLKGWEEAENTIENEWGFLQETITGRVIDAQTGEGLPGVNVIVAGSEEETGSIIGTQTDIGGSYSINVPAELNILVFTYIGYQRLEVDVDGRTEIDVQLQHDMQMLDDVVVTALGLERDRRSIGHSITEVRADALVQGTEGNLVNLLQGQVAGVQVSSVGGGLGTSSRVVIRGVSTLDGHNQPLYIIDGVPIDNSVPSGRWTGNTGQYGGADGGDGIQSINPADIESMTVLRGASAAALYGERAKDGVILITTKRGSEGNVQVNFSNATTFDVLNTNQQNFQTIYGQGTQGQRPQDPGQAGSYMQRSWGEKFDGQPTIQMDGELYPYTDLGDPQVQFYRTATSIRNDVSVSGGTQSATYYLSASNLSQKGIVPNSDLGRTSLTFRGTAAIGRLHIDAKANYIDENVNNRPSISDLPGNINTPIIFLARNVPLSILQENIYHEDGRAFLLPSGSRYQSNPYWTMNEWGNVDNRDRWIAHLNFNLDLTDWLILHGRTGLDTYTLRRTEWQGWGTTHLPDGRFGERDIQRREMNSELLLTGNRTLTSYLNFEGMLGVALRNSQGETLGFNGTAYIFPRVNTISNFETITTSYSYSEKEVRSVMGALNLDYNDYLFLNLTGRNDWSSTLPVDRNAFFYPSIGTSFVFSNAFESSLPDWLSFGQLRASWAQVGSDTSPYNLYLTYGISQPAFGGVTRAQIGTSTVPLADLKPSITEEVELGFDIRFLDDRLGLDVAYYDRNTTNQILSVDVSETTGFTGRRINAGRLDNYGFEVSLMTVPVAQSNFLWRSVFNYARNKSIIRSLVSESQFMELERSRRENAWVVAQVGEEFGQLYGTSFQRDDDGNIVHQNGLPLVGENKILGRGSPTWIGGWINTFSYREFTMNLNFDVQWGGQIHSGTNSQLYGNGRHHHTLLGRDVCDAAPKNASSGRYLNCFVGKGVDVDGGPNQTAVNPQNYWGRIGGSASNGIAEAFVYDANVIYMRQISFSYRLPVSFTSQIGLNSARISIIARNPFIIYNSVPNVDPTATMNRTNAQGLEMNQVPSIRSVGFNVDIQL